MNALDAFGRFFGLSIVGLMAVGAIAILLYNLTHRDRPKPMLTESCRLVFWLVVPGLFACLSGMALMVLPHRGHENFGGVLAGAGFLLMLGGTFLNVAVAKTRRKAWPVVAAQCTYQQLQIRQYSGEGGPRDGWLWQVVCEIKYGGKHYTVSPKVHWSDLGQVDAPFWSEAKARQFISRKISPKGECQLRLNPDNPLEAELL
jgi:hypothetical protein